MYYDRCHLALWLTSVTMYQTGVTSLILIFSFRTKTIDLSAITGIVNISVTRLVDNHKPDLRGERCDVGGGGVVRMGRLRLCHPWIRRM